MEDTFIHILREHAARYPLMEPQDYGKLIYQSEFGPEHMVSDSSSARSFLLEEFSALPWNSTPWFPESIGNGLCRFPVSACPSEKAAQLLADLFVLTAQEQNGSREFGTMDGLLQKLELTAELKIPGMKEWAADWKQKECPPVHHSKTYREAYHPHYRLLSEKYAAFFPVLLEILEAAKLTGEGKTAVIGIDGRCGSGKTFFANLIHRLLPCNVLHMDDFYLPIHKRAENWRSTPGGNMDFARFHQEVLLPVKSGESVLYRPYNCQKGEMEEALTLHPQPLAVVEGSYSHHPLLEKQYDLKVFLTCSKQTQSHRLQAREGSNYTAFAEQWIPMEENYFRQYDIEAGSDLVISTDS